MPGDDLYEQPWCHVTTDVCPVGWCDWAGMHWHWDGQRFRSARELDRFDLELMDEHLRHPAV